MSEVVIMSSELVVIDADVLCYVDEKEADEMYVFFKQKTAYEI